MNILLTGATGFIGGSILRELSKQNCNTFALSRKKHIGNSFTNVKWIVFDFNNAVEPKQWEAVLQDIDIVINTVGIIQETSTQKFSVLHTQAPIALFKMCATSSVKRIIQISALGADENAITAYQKSKVAADSYLKKTTLDWTILQPSIVYGPGDLSMNFFKAMSAQILTPIIGNGMQEIQPVRVKDLSKAVIQAVMQKKGLGQTIPVTGADIITIKNLMQELRMWIGLGKAHIIEIPLSIMTLVAKLSNFIRGAMLTTDTLLMLNQGNTSSTKPFQKSFGFMPRGLLSELKLNPSTTQDRLFATTFFLKPILRYAIAIVWIGSGIVSAFLSEIEGYKSLAKLGLYGTWADISLYGASALDIILGIAVIIRYKPRLSSRMQALLVIGYTCIISYYIPSYWLDPFGAILKNLIVIAAILVWGEIDYDS